MVLGKLPVPGRLLNLIIVGQMPTALTVGAGGGLYGQFFISRLSVLSSIYLFLGGWSDGAMGLGKLPMPGHPTIRMIVGQGPIALAVGAGGGCLDIFTLLYPFSSLSPSFWEAAQYRLKYCLKGPLNLKQPTNQPLSGASYNLDIVGETPVTPAVGAGGGCLDSFSLINPFSPRSPSLWETA